MISADLGDFDRGDLEHRLLRGGLPPMFLANELPERDFQDWIDAYWAKDVQELFRLERHWSFQRFLELLFAQSGGMFEATRFAAPCEATFVAHVVRPFSSRHRGWDALRAEDLGLLWEHFVLNEVHGRLQRRDLRYWRSKQGAGVDFVLPGRGERGPVAIECKWKADGFAPAALAAFRRIYPDGPSLVVATDVDAPLQAQVRQPRGRVRLARRADRTARAPPNWWLNQHSTLVLPKLHAN